MVLGDSPMAVPEVSEKETAIVHDAAVIESSSPQDLSPNEDKKY